MTFFSCGAESKQWERRRSLDQYYITEQKREIKISGTDVGSAKGEKDTFF
jgi:hypothetical protein